jgi:hypothetical protein
MGFRQCSNAPAEALGGSYLKGGKFGKANELL